MKLLGAEINCENLCEAKVYELVYLSHRDFPESRDSCITLLCTHRHHELHYSIFYDQWALRYTTPSIMQLSVAETICENLCEAKVYELVSLSHRHFAESRDSNTTLLCTHRHRELYYSIFYDQWALSCTTPSSQFLYAIYISCWLVLKTVSRTMTFCPH